MGKYMRNGKGVEKLQEVSHCCHSHGPGSSLGVRTRARAALAALHEKENGIAHAIASNSPAATPKSSPANSAASHHRHHHHHHHHHHHLRGTTDKTSAKLGSKAVSSSSSPPISPSRHEDDQQKQQQQPCSHRMELRSCRKLRLRKGSSLAVRPKGTRSNGNLVAADLSGNGGTALNVSEVQHRSKQTSICGSADGSYDDSTSIEASATDANENGSSRVLRQMRSSSANSAAGCTSDCRASAQKPKHDLSIHIPPNLSCSTSIQPSHERINNNTVYDHVNPSPSPSPSLQHSAICSPERRLDTNRRPLGVLTRYQRQVLFSNIASQENADDQAAGAKSMDGHNLHGDQNGLTSSQIHHIEREPCSGESPLMVAARPSGAIARPRRHAVNRIETRGQQKNTSGNPSSVPDTADREEEYSCSVAGALDAMEPSVFEAPGSTSNTPHRFASRINSPSPSPSPVSSAACFAANNNDHNRNVRPRSAPPFTRTNARECPSSGEIEAFLANAEQQQRRRFMDRYNFDPLREKALRGRYEWQKLMQ